jgi:hypothetical protein
MADVEDPNGSGMVEAEPTECCRCMLIWVMAFFFLVFFSISQSTDHFHEYFPPSKARDVAKAVVGLLALFPAGWSAIVFSMLVADWYNGNPEGERVVDSLLQSERGVFLESFRQYLHRIKGGD